MRIGILTFHKVINYGAYLQAFALSNMLKKQLVDVEVEIVDYVVNYKRRNRMILANFKHNGIKGGISEIKRIWAFNSVQKFLSLSPQSWRACNLNDLYSYIDNRYDMLIIGSDAVFNWNQTKFPTAFIPDYQFSIPVYTYAASVHGLRFYDVGNDKLEKCGKVFEAMKLVGVRDACSEKFVKLCSPKAKTMHCCDPTVFIDKDEIYAKGRGVEKKIEKKYGFSLDSKYIVVMAPDSPMLEAVYKKYSGDYKIVSVFVKSAYSDFYISDLNPFEWTVVLKKAAVVVTSYFHGTLLSLVQGTPAIVLDYSGYCDERYEGKLKDLLVTRLALPELYHDKEDAINFNNDATFLDKMNAALAGDYAQRIDNAMANERNAFNDFLEAVKEGIQS